MQGPELNIHGNITDWGDKRIKHRRLWAQESINMRNRKEDILTWNGDWETR